MFENGGFNPFSLPALMCQAQTRDASFASCVPILFNQLKTCACMDFQPMYNLVCPTSPTASLCSRNAAVQEFLALNTNSSLGIFTPMSNFGRLMDPQQETDFHPCGDRSMYRSTILINSIGSCLTDIVNAFPFPTWFNATGPQGSIFARGAITCSLTAPSYLLSYVCAGNSGKCYSAIDAPSSNLNLCASFTGSCSAGCRNQLSAFGNVSSNSPGKCCVNYFSQKTENDCSQTPTLSLSDVMGPQCTSFMKDSFSNGNIPTDPRGPNATQLAMMLSQKALPKPCPFGSRESSFIRQCNVPATNLEGACPSSDDNTPWVQSSLFAPVKSTTVTMKFASTGLSTVISEKYAETLTAVANALSKQLPSTFTVIPISVVAGTGRRLLQADQFTAKLGVTSTLLSGTVNPATTISSINATTLAGSLQTELQNQVSSQLNVSVSPSSALSATPEQVVPPPTPFPGGTLPPEPTSSPPAQTAKPSPPPATGKVSSSSFNTPSFAMMMVVLICMTLIFS